MRAPLFFALSFVVAASGARAGCNESCEDKQMAHNADGSMTDKCVPKAPPPPGCPGANDVNVTAADPTLKITPPPPPPPTKQITKEELTSRIRVESDKATKEYPDYAKVIRTTSRLMIDNINNSSAVLNVRLRRGSRSVYNKNRSTKPIAKVFVSVEDTLQIRNMLGE